MRMQTFENFLTESSLSRLYDHNQKHDCGIITAFRYARECGTGIPYTKTENLKRNSSLLGDLRSKGYGVTAVKGAYIENYGSKDAREVQENSFFVVDIKDSGNLRTMLRTYGTLYEQDSILFLPKGGKSGELIGTNTCPNGYPGFTKSVHLKNPVFGQNGQFMTKVNGRPFILKECL